MATYKDVIGTGVRSLANRTGTVEGQIWYDTSTGEFKIEVDVDGTKTSKVITTKQYPSGYDSP
jgi:hypothetical protein